MMLNSEMGRLLCNAQLLAPNPDLSVISVQIHHR